MVIFKIFLNTKSDPNIHQNAPNWTISKIFCVFGFTPCGEKILIRGQGLAVKGGFKV